jgi:hypothetical protein
VSHGIDPVAHGQGAVWGQGQTLRMGPMHRVLNSVTTLLGVDKSTLIGDLRSGQSLSDIATAQGVTSDDLLNAVTQALTTTHGKSGSHGFMAKLGLDSATLAQQLIDSTSWFSGGGKAAGAGQGNGAGPTSGSLVDVVA